jgi:tetratricopeptide (TPR) repeat protein
MASGFAVAGVYLFLGRLIHPAVPMPTWSEIQQAAVAQRWDEVEPKLKRWVVGHPKHGEGLVVLAELYQRRGKNTEAAQLFSAVPQSSNFWLPAQTALGEQALQNRQAALAESVFRDLAVRYPTAIPPRQRLIYLLSLEQRTAEAREVLWRIYRIQNDPRVLVDLVLELLQDQQDVRGFGPELHEFLGHAPEDPFLRRAWGLALLYQGKAPEALPYLEAAARDMENDPAGRLALAECRISLGLSIDLPETLGPCPHQKADAASWWLYRGRLEEAIGRPADAVNSYQQAIDRQPSNREAHFRLGKIEERLGNAVEGGRHLSRATELSERFKAVRREHQSVRRTGLPRDPEVYQRLGDSCLRIGLVQEARAWFEECLLLDPVRDQLKIKLAELSLLPDSMPVLLPRPTLLSEGKARPPDALAIKNTDEQTTAVPAHYLTSEAIVLEDQAATAGIEYRYESGANDGYALADTTGGGVGLIDYDGDGWLDVYFVGGCAMPLDPAHPSHPNRLYRNQRDGTFRDVTVLAGVAGAGYGMGCAVGDYDNDGDDDLFVTGYGRTILYCNGGNGTFEDVTAKAGVTSDRWTTAAGFGDLDGDGDLDLVVTTYVEVPLDDPNQCRDYLNQRIHCTPAIFPAQLDLLYRNDGDGTFTEVSHVAGFEAPGGRGLGLAIADFDEDGKLDIFVANDGSPNFLFHNLGGLKFEEIGTAAGVATNGSGRATASMGVVADDLDGDGRIDLFITNWVNESSTFLRNLGNGLFQDATLGAGLDAPTRPKTGFGDAAFDADNDGVLDLIQLCGHVDDRPWANSPMAQTPLLFRGTGRGRFVVVNDRNPTSYTSKAVVGRGLAAGDLDNDGRVDLVAIARDGPAAVLRNQTRAGHWLGIKLRGTVSGKTPVGTRVSCLTANGKAVRWATGGTGYLSAHDPRLWFGLGASSHVQQLEVHWPSGRIQTWKDLEADRILEIDEGPEQVREGLRNLKSGPSGETAFRR